MPPSPFQKIWLADQQENNGPLQSTAASFQLEGPLNIELAKRVVGEIWSRHEALRNGIRNQGDRVQLRIHESSPCGLGVIDLGGLSRSEGDAAWERLVSEAAARQFDPATEPLARVTLARLQSDRHRLFLSAHPIACDATSAERWAAEFARIYGLSVSGRSAPRPNGAIPSHDLVLRARFGRRSERAKSDLAYWRSEVAGLSASRRSFADQVVAGHDRITVATEKILLPTPLCRDLRRAAVANPLEGALEAMLLSIFVALLHRYSGEDDLPVGVVIHARSPRENSQLIGCFVDHQVMRTRFSTGLTVGALHEQTLANRARAAQHLGLPLQMVLEQCREPNSSNGHTRANHRDLFHAVFSMRTSPPPVLRFSDIVMTPLEINEPILSCDLALSLVPDGERLVARLIHHREAVSPAFAKFISRHFVKALAAAVERPDLPVDDLPLMDADECRLVTVNWNRTDVGLDQNVCLHELLEVQARQSARASAVVHQNRQMSYEELDESANRLAGLLQQLGIRPDTRVAICLEPSVDLMVSMIAVLKAGGAYTPVPTSIPQERVRFLLEDTQARVLITRQSLVGDASQIPCHLVLLDVHAAEIARQGAEVRYNHVTPENLAYVIYTSGSTGEPKGVMVSHRAICNTLQWRQSTLPFAPDDRVLLSFSFAFDASIFQLFQPLLAGASVVIPETEHGGDPRRIIESIRNHRITVLGVTPSLLDLLLKQPDFGQCDSVRVLFCGGEPLSADAPEKIKGILDAEMYNMYGPTEASMEATCWNCVPRKRIVIGRPIANVHAYVLDRQLRPSPVGIAGELYLAGAGLARGYLNEPGLTAERFQPNPFDPVTGARMYRTGDICRWLPDGSLEILGRQDQQIKLHGHRIELSEIETVLQRSTRVSESAVVLREDRPGERRIIAYVVPEPSMEIDSDGLRSYLRSHLPCYMIPSAFVRVESLPRTATGKLDPRALPLPGRAQSSRAPATPSMGALERFLADLWMEVLQVQSVAEHDNFFELGGSSIQVAILTHKLEDVLKEFVYTVTLYDVPTIQKLAHYLRLHYPQSVLRLFGPAALNGSSPSRGEAVDPSSIALLRNLIRPLPERTSNPPSPRNPSAIFVLSPPRSGSTLLRVMMGGHPSLFAPPELQLLNFNSLRERKAALASERDNFWLQGSIRALMEIHGCDFVQATKMMDDFERRDLSVREFYGLLQSWLGKVTLVEKTPNYALDLRTLQRAEQDFENARYIHLIRHPSPAIASFEEARLHVFFPPFFTGEHPFTTCQLAELVWNICHQNIRAFLETVPSERKFAIRFEDLVRFPKETMEQLSAFLGLPFHSHMRNPYERDPRAQMTDAIHPLGRMLGDVKFHQHGRIRADAAERLQGRFPEAALGKVTRELAGTLGYPVIDRRPSALEGLQVRGTAPPFFCVHPAGGTVACYHELAQHLGPTQPFYAFRAVTEDPTVSLPRSVQDLASSYLKQLREHQPHGPYQLGGWSFGGLVAFEMALKLTAEGEQVPVLALFSSRIFRSRASHLPLRSRDFVLEFLREHQLELGPAADALSGWELLKQVFERTKHAGLVSPELRLRDFRRVIARHGRVFRAHVRMGRKYFPRARVSRLILFDVEDDSTNGNGLDWKTVATQVSRHLVPGNHFTMLREPNARHIADSLRKYLLSATDPNLLESESEGPSIGGRYSALDEA